jgi:hypothetical protein
VLGLRQGIREEESKAQAAVGGAVGDEGNGSSSSSKGKDMNGVQDNLLRGAEALEEAEAGAKGRQGGR